MDRTAARAVGLLVIGIVVAGCLPPTVGPSPTPGPSQSAVASTLPPRTPSPTPGPPTPTPGPTFLLHRVRSGENLTSIARAYGTTPRSLAFWNRDAYPSLDPDSPTYSPNRIEVGWTLRVLPNQVVDETLITPPPSGAATPRPSLVIPAGPTPLPSGASLFVSAAPRGGNAVALTFELGGRVTPSAAAIEWLVANDVPATIFISGALVDDPTGLAVLREVAAHPDLFTVGSLGQAYADPTRATPAGLAADLDAAERAIGDALGRSPRPVYRPPFGAHDASVRATVGSAGYAFTVLWDVDSLDWRSPATGGPTADDIRAKVASRAEGGSILAFTLGGSETVEALPLVLAALRDQGLEPVTLHRLLGIDPG